MFLMFLFLLRYEFVFASLRSFIVCFVRKADLSLTYSCEGQVYYEMNAFIHPESQCFSCPMLVAELQKLQQEQKEDS